MIVDKPRVGSKPVSRVKTLTLGGGIGAAVGLLAVTLLFVVLLRRDRSAYSSEDLRSVTELPVMLELPQLSGAMVVAAMRARSALHERVSMLR